MATKKKDATNPLNGKVSEIIEEAGVRTVKFDVHWKDYTFHCKLTSKFQEDAEIDVGVIASQRGWQTVINLLPSQPNAQQLQRNMNALAESNPGLYSQIQRKAALVGGDIDTYLRSICIPQYQRQMEGMFPLFTIINAMNVMRLEINNEGKWELDINDAYADFVPEAEEQDYAAYDVTHKAMPETLIVVGTPYEDILARTRAIFRHNDGLMQHFVNRISQVSAEVRGTSERFQS